MKSEKKLYEIITDKWTETENKINQMYSSLAENNKKLHESHFDSLVSSDETQKALWEMINLLDQLSIESSKDQAIIVNALRTLLEMWHEYQDQPAMKNTSNRFVDDEISRIVKSMHTDKLIANAINELRNIALTISTNANKSSTQ